MKTSDPPMGFETFCRQAWPDRFTVSFTREEVGDVASVRDLRTAARAVMTGGLHAVVLERGKGKTTLACACVIWMAHEGLRRFPVLLSRDESAASEAHAMITAMVEKANGKWRRSVGIHVPISLDGPIVGIERSGVRDKIERPDFLVFDDPADGMVEKIGRVVATMAGPGKPMSALLLGDLAICRALQAKGWAGT